MSTNGSRRRRLPDRPSTPARSRTRLLFRAAAAGRADVLGRAGLLRVQRAAGNGAASGLVEEERSPVLDVVSSGGRALDEPVRDGHGGPARRRLLRRTCAHRRCRRRLGPVGAGARLHGRVEHRVPARQVRPGSSAGQTLLAHELTHVVQQRSGPVDGTARGGVKVSDPSDRFEREAAANAERVMSQPAPAAPVQREPATAQRRRGPARGREAEEEEVQTATHPSVQREEEERRRRPPDRGERPAMTTARERCPHGTPRAALDVAGARDVGCGALTTGDRPQAAPARGAPGCSGRRGTRGQRVDGREAEVARRHRPSPTSTRALRRSAGTSRRSTRSRRGSKAAKDAGVPWISRARSRRHRRWR